MTSNMEENWKEKMWARSRDRIAETYQRASSVDIEALLNTSILGHVGKDMLNTARRKYDFKGSDKHIKLRQFVTRLRMGRLGYLILLFAALGSLAVPLMFQDILPQQVDHEFERAMTIRDNKERGVDEAFNRKMHLAEEKNLIYEEGKSSVEISGNKHEIIAGVSDQEEDVEDDMPSKENITAVVTSEGVNLPDLVQQGKKSGELERDLSESHDFPSIRESKISIPEERSDRHQKATQSVPSRPKRNDPKRRTVIEESSKLADEKNVAVFSDEAKENRDNLDPHAIISSAETVSYNMAPPDAPSTNDTVGSSNGFTEAFEEVLKLASEANKTAREKSAQLQEESSLTELLPTDKPAELDVQVLGVTNVAFQNPLKDINDSTENKDTMASAGFVSEEHKRDISVGGGNDALREAAHYPPQIDLAFSRKEERATEILVLDPIRENVKSQDNNLLSSKESLPVDESGSSAVSTDFDVTSTVGNSNESTIASSGQVVQGSDPEVGLEEKSKEAWNNLETSSILDGGVPVNDTESENTLSRVEDDNDVKIGAMDGEKPDDGAAEEQVLQAEVRQENSDDWPQESALISSLRRRAASGTLRVGLLNMEATDFQRWQFLAGEVPIIIPFERVNETVEWNHLYPEWIDEEERYGTPNCPSIPMPKVSPEVQLDVVIASAPCTASSALQDGWRRPASLQVLLGAASLAVKAGNESVYVLILSECRPLVNLFTCGELLENRDQGWLYQVNLEQLRKRISLPVGSCQLSVSLQGQDASLDVGASNSLKETYATILHSGGDYVCGAIATAHSIRKTGSTKDLVILVDSSVSLNHRQALQEAGWKVRDLERIYTSSTVGGKQYEKDFSKFRLWQLTDYNKVIYVEADVLVLRNLDHLFRMPEVSASGSTKTLFNSGVMVIEPSNCTFQLLIDEMEKTVSEIGGDWDLFNKIFPWWHRIPRHMNYLKYFWTRQNNEADYMNRLFSSDPPQLYAIHYWGYKPWQCFRDYDCNWNANQQFASDEAHAQWFKVYDEMPQNLQRHCALSTATKAYLEHNRRTAEAAALADRHWAVTITDPRLNVCQENHCDWNTLLSHWDKTVNTTSTVVASTR